MKALLSIHDVRPHSIDDVLQLIELMNSLHLPPASLLVVPGDVWKNHQIDTLKHLAVAGHAMVGHGWRHRVREIRGMRHRLHALMLSRQAAEHLSLSAEEVEHMIHQCFEWFGTTGLPYPDLYVPPAWGLGKLSRRAMKRLPFRWYETLTGIYDSECDSFTRLPLVGFEADTMARRIALGATNHGCLTMAKWCQRPVRIAIHPYDLSLNMGKLLRKLLRSALEPTTLRQGYQ